MYKPIYIETNTYIHGYNYACISPREASARTAAHAPSPWRWRPTSSRRSQSASQPK